MPVKEVAFIQLDRLDRKYNFIDSTSDTDLLMDRRHFPI